MLIESEPGVCSSRIINERIQPDEPERVGKWTGTETRLQDILEPVIGENRIFGRAEARGTDMASHCVLDLEVIMCDVKQFVRSSKRQRNIRLRRNVTKSGR